MSRKQTKAQKIALRRSDAAKRGWQTRTERERQEMADARLAHERTIFGGRTEAEHNAALLAEVDAYMPSEKHGLEPTPALGLTRDQLRSGKRSLWQAVRDWVGRMVRVG